MATYCMPSPFRRLPDMAHFSHLLIQGAVDGPSDWVCRHAAHIRPGGRVLDLACGSGHNARWLASNGWQVEAVDRDSAALDSLQGIERLNVTLADLESGPWPYDIPFDGIVVCRYLHRPLLPRLAGSLAKGGVLIYETFMAGQERFGRPSNPDFLLQPDELSDVYAATLEVVAFEQGQFDSPKPCMMQRICAKNK